MKTFNYLAARAVCKRTQWRGLMEADYFGPLCLGALEALAPQVLDATQEAAAVMIRMDSSLTLINAMPLMLDVFKKPPPPACVVVRADQFDLWQCYANLLAEHGIRRIVFLDSQLALALLWMERRSVYRDH